jgi:hypothetical protein
MEENQIVQPVPRRRRGPRVAPAPTVESLTIKLNYANRRCKYAWAKYYEAIHQNLHDDFIQYERIERVVTEEALPVHIKSELKEMASILKKKWECPICIEFIAEDELEITNCGHFYCKGCLENLKNSYKEKEEDKWCCAVCRKKHGFRED